MLNLFEIEIESQRLDKLYGSIATNGYKIISFTTFLKKIIKSENPDKYFPYLILNIEKLLGLISKPGDIFLSYEDYSNIEEILSYSRKNGISETLRAKLNDAEAVIGKRKKELENFLFNKNIDIQETSSFSPNSISIVLIEESIDENIKIEYGEIHKLILNSSLRTKGENIDKVEFLNTVDSENIYTLDYLSKLTTLSKSYARKTGIESGKCNFSFYFERKDFIYKGNSLGLAAICLAYNSILINNINKYYFRFREDCVFTGEIDDKGNLLILSTDSLKQKIKTVFYSKYSKFIIPEDNLAEAKAELEKLNLIYPARKLELIPCKSFESVFKNLDIVERFELRFHEKLKANYHKYHRAANWTFTIFTFLIIVYFVFVHLLPNLDRNPVRAEFNDCVYSAYNKYDIKVWEYTEPEKKHIEHKKFSENFFTSVIKISDIDNDGVNEIIYANNVGNDKPEGKDFVICCNANNEIKWKFQLPKTDFVYEWESDSLKGDWMFRHIVIDDINNDGKKEIIANAYFCPFFPDRLVILNNEGKLISEYWHSGYFNCVSALDIDKDGYKEIIASGINNYPGYRCGSLVVLDPNKMAGASFKTDPLKSGIKGTEKYYVLFPKTLMTTFNVSNFNTADYFVESGNNLFINVLDGPMEKSFMDNAHLVYQFDKDMNVVNISTSNQFNKAYDNLLSEGKIQPISNMQVYLDSLKTRVRWWNGEEFEFKPVVNKHYLLFK